MRGTLRLVDYVNTEHEPVGQTYRAVLQDDFFIGTTLVAAQESRAMLRLLSDGAAGVTLDWFAIRFGDEWFEMRTPDARSDGASVLKTKTSGPLLYFPPGSVLQFELKRPARLISVGHEGY